MELKESAYEAAVEAARGWGSVLIGRWVDRASRLGLHHSGELLRSFTQGAVEVSGGMLRVGPQFAQHGLFAEWGVHRGLPIHALAPSGAASLRAEGRSAGGRPTGGPGGYTTRHTRPFHTRGWSYQQQRLAELIGRAVAQAYMEQLSKVGEDAP